MKRKKKNLFIILIPIVLLLFACDYDRLAKGNQAPDFKLKSIDAADFKLSDYRGKVVLVHFWTDWCASCRAEFPRVENFYSELKSDDFELLAINVGQPGSVSKDFKKSFGITFPMLTDEEALSKDLYQIEVFPTNYFISPEGKIIRRIVGWVDKEQVQVIINQNKVK